MRWLLLDEVISIERGKSARSRSHVPDAPVSAELLLIEMMAQTGGLLAGAESDFRNDLVFAKIEEAVFAPGLKPGDSLEIEARAESLNADGGWIDAEITAAGSTLARARLLLMNAGQLIPGQTKPISFHEAFMNHFHVREKVR